MSKRPLAYWNILGEGARKASNAKIKNKNQRIFFSGRKIYQRIIMVMRIPVINLSSLSKQSGAEIESMIEHLEDGKYSFVVCFRRMRLTRRAVTSDFAIEMQVQ